MGFYSLPGEGTVLNQIEGSNEDGSFDEDAVRVLSAAFDAAWQAARMRRKLWIEPSG